MKLDGKEALFELTLDEAWPVMCLRESEERFRGEPGVVAIPEAMVRKLRDARAAEREAVHEIARWVKYGKDEQAKRDIKQIIDELPSAAERKEARKR